MWLVLSGAVAATLSLSTPSLINDAQAREDSARAECKIITAENRQKCCQVITRDNVDACEGRPCIQPPPTQSVRLPVCYLGPQKT